jgi:hypothetical protein
MPASDVVSRQDSVQSMGTNGSVVEELDSVVSEEVEEVVVLVEVELEVEVEAAVLELVSPGSAADSSRAQLEAARRRAK